MEPISTTTSFPLYHWPVENKYPIRFKGAPSLMHVWVPCSRDLPGSIGERYPESKPTVPKEARTKGHMEQRGSGSQLSQLSSAPSEHRQISKPRQGPQSCEEKQMALSCKGWTEQLVTKQQMTKNTLQGNLQNKEQQSSRDCKAELKGAPDIRSTCP